MDMNISLLPEAVACGRAENKEQVLAEVSAVFARAYGLDAEAVNEAMEQREALGSTGFGRGVAIPHCRSAEVSRPKMVLLKLPHAVDFRAADAIPVELVFGLVSPDKAGATHLQALAAISRLTRDEAMLAALLDAAEADALFAILNSRFLRDAA